MATNVVATPPPAMARIYDGELAAALDALPQLDWADPAAQRERVAEMGAEAAAQGDARDVPFRDLEIPAAQPLPLRIYTPRQAMGPLPAALFLHGGGWVFGDLDSEHTLAAETAETTGCVVVSVGYRLAPEDPFPAGLDDAWRALLWTADQAPTLGIDAGRIAVCGGSAGANLAAALTLRARDHDGPRIVYQQLVVPALDDRLDTPSAQHSADTPILDSAALAWIWRHYTAGASEPSEHAAPARAHDLSGLPPAYIETAEHDPLRDEGLIYASRLMQAGVPVELHQYPGTFHGSAEIVPDAMLSRSARRRRHAALRSALAETALPSRR